mmetsp:Transcript_34861/g.51193  ORF Transcript_34861/g.51193 Transcript_34861/m.51193 type:complete len:83 (+) Transcript_34861:2363-2611(+)
MVISHSYPFQMMTWIMIEEINTITQMVMHQGQFIVLRLKRHAAPFHLMDMLYTNCEDEATCSDSYKIYNILKSLKRNDVQFL